MIRGITVETNKPLRMGRLVVDSLQWIGKIALLMLFSALVITFMLRATKTNSNKMHVAGLNGRIAMLLISGTEEILGSVRQFEFYAT